MKGSSFITQNEAPIIVRLHPTLQQTLGEGVLSILIDYI